MSMTDFAAGAGARGDALAAARDRFQDWLASVRALDKSHLVWLSIFGGALLMLIGVRFMIVPQSASFTFGVGSEVSGTELHQIIGVRDIWLGGMAVLFAVMREWRALAAWFILAAGVCIYDAGIVFSTTANAWAMAFHCASGVFCWKVGRACGRQSTTQVSDRSARDVSPLT